jgi:hypothetical protein
MPSASKISHDHDHNLLLVWLSLSLPPIPIPHLPHRTSHSSRHHSAHSAHPTLPPFLCARPRARSQDSHHIPNQHLDSYRTAYSPPPPAATLLAHHPSNPLAASPPLSAISAYTRHAQPPSPNMDGGRVRRKDTTKGPPLRILSLGTSPA